MKFWDNFILSDEFQYIHVYTRKENYRSFSYTSWEWFSKCYKLFLYYYGNGFHKSTGIVPITVKEKFPYHNGNRSHNIIEIVPMIDGKYSRTIKKWMFFILIKKKKFQQLKLIFAK